MEDEDNAKIPASAIPGSSRMVHKQTNPLFRWCSMNIYVGNLPIEVTEDELRQEFVTFGQVISVSIRDNKHFGSVQARYGFVEMASKTAGEVAVSSLNGNRMRGCVIDVVGALPLSDKSDTQPRRSRRDSRFTAKGSQDRY